MKVETVKDPFAIKCNENVLLLCEVVMNGVQERTPDE